MEEKYPAGKMSIYFGSQTGTATGFAKLLGMACRNQGFNVQVIDLGDFTPTQLAESRLAVFLVSTYGEGDPTDNALHFYEWLCNPKEAIPNTYLSNVSFAVFGLGNSTYVNYNKMGKRCNELLELIGGQRIFPFACGDDSCTLEEDFEKWKASIVEFLGKKYLATGEEPLDVHPRAHLTFTTQVVPQSDASIPDPTEINTTTKYFYYSPLVTLTAVRDLRSPADPRRSLHLEFDISTTEIKYNPADNLAIVAENDPKVVESFAFCCGGYDLSQCVQLVPVKMDEDVELASTRPFRFPFPNPCTIQTILTKYLDICGIPRRSTLERFGAYVKDKDQRQWLDDLISSENRTTFTKLIELEGRSYVSLFAKELSSCVIPLADLLHIIPFIQPRFYTISSSSSLYPKSIHLTVSLLHRKSPSEADVYGFCTQYLSSLSVGDRCRIFLRESNFKLPASIRTPVIMIGPGSGFAPMRALIQEREFQAKQQGVPFEEVENVLYFGCKSRSLDFLYQEELSDALERHVLTALHLAFSRDTDQRVYVQHIMREPQNAEEIFRLLSSGAHVYVCGGTDMGAAVAESFASILANNKGLSLDEGLSLIKEAQLQKTYKQELWSV